MAKKTKKANVKGSQILKDMTRFMKQVKSLEQSGVSE